MDVRIGPQRRLSAEELMLSNCVAGEDSEYSLEGVMLKLQYFGNLMQKASSLEKTLMLGRTGGRRRGG